MDENTDKPKKANMKVLIAEDEEISYVLLEEILSKFSLELLRAKNGREAIEIIENDPNIGLVLLDIKMPEMSGLEVARIIKKKRPDLPIIAETAYASEDNKDDVVDAGFDDYVFKPIDKRILIEKIQKFIPNK